MVAGMQFGEPVMTLVEAAGWLERRFGRRPNVASVWRWATKGIKGVRLATIALGRFRYTTESALERFVAETSRTDAGGRSTPDHDRTSPASSAPEFSTAEITAARRRREQEKARAMEYLRSSLGDPGSRGKSKNPTAKSAVGTDSDTVTAASPALS